MASKPVASLDHIASNMFRKGGWSPGTVDFTYSFPTQKPSGYSKVFGEGKTFTTFGLEQRSWAQEAMNLWADIIDVKSINLGSGDHGELRLMNTRTHDGGVAHAKSPGTKNFGDVWVHADVASNFDLGYGKFAFGTLIHEIGHALGLQHPGNYDASDGPANYDDDAAYFQDSLQYTVMSYFGAENTGGAFFGVDVQTPMLHDIWVMQQRYGANMETRTGNTVYGFGSNANRGVYDFDINKFPVIAIWDAGGTDMLSLSQATGGVRLDLRPGSFSDALGLKRNIAIAHGTWIENASGGKGNDTVIGNELDNALYGLGNYDKLYGRQGNDSLYGGNQDDYLYGEQGNDRAWGGNGNDRLFGDAGDDQLHGDAGNDSLYGGAGADILWGGAGDDYLSGNVGIDTFFGGAGRDTVSFLYSSASWYVVLNSLTGAPHAAAHGSQELLHSIEAVEMGKGHDTVHGSEADNRLQGGDGNDRLYGYAGNDTLEGGNGNDRLYRASGNNVLQGGAGIDTVDYGQTQFAIHVDLHNQFSSQVVVDLPGTANDQIDRLRHIEVLLATVHNDTIKGATTVNNVLDGRAGNDELWGRGGNNNLIGGFGNDRFYSGSGNDTLNGGIGSDTAIFELGTQGITVNLALSTSQAIAGFGTDRLISIENLVGTKFTDWLYGNAFANNLRGLAGADQLFGLGGADTLIGDDGNDRLDGGSGDDFLDGGDGNDILIPGAGNDFVGGGLGADTVDYSGATGGVKVDLAVTVAQFVSAEQGSDRILDVESVVGSNGGNDTLKGTNGSNKLYGLGGNDLIEARGGNDIIDGGMGYDTASYESSPNGVTVSLGNSLPQNTQSGIDSLISIEALIGSEFDDILIGDLVGNRLYGRGGNDWLSGGEGHDWLDGGAGDDVLFGGPGDDTMVGNTGSDTVSYLFSPSGVVVSLHTANQTTGGAGNDRILSVENVDGSLFADTLGGNLIANHLSGLDGNDVLSGFGGDDTLRGGAGQDTLHGGAGDDLLFGGPGADLLDGGDGIDTASYETAQEGVLARLANPAANTGDAAGDGYVSVENVRGSAFNDTLGGTAGDNRLQGMAGNDRLEGGAGHDTLAGGAGNDTLIGGGGIDFLTGGNGADRFVFASAAHSGLGANADRILDFSKPQGDRIHLSGIDADTATGADDAFVFIGQTAFSGVAGQLRIAIQNGNTIVQGDIDGDASADFMIRVVGVEGLNAGHFIL